jgi:DNA-binding NarL/FixJ family response regulator
VLGRIRSDEWKHFLPVVIFSFCDELEDVLEAYRHGANSFVAKSVGYERFAEIHSSRNIRGRNCEKLCHVDRQGAQGARRAAKDAVVSSY